MKLGIPQSNVLAPLAVLGSVVSLCVGSSYAKTLFPELGAQGVTAYRVGFSAIMLLLFWRPWRFSLTKEDARKILLYGVALGLMNLCFYMSIRTLPIGIAIAIEFIGPLALAIFASRRIIDFVWIICAVVGLALLLPIGQNVQSVDPTGLCFVLAAAFFWAMYIISGQRAGSSHVGQVTSFGLLTASFVVVPFGIVQAGSMLLNPKFIALGLAVAVLSSAIPFTLEMFALKRLPKQTFGILCSMEPAAGALFGWLILSESLTVIQMIAIGCIILASVGSSATSKNSEGPPIAQVDPIAP